MTKQIFDVIIVADFRFPGGTSSAVAAEIRALRQGGYSVALYQIDAPILTNIERWNDRITGLVDAGDAVVLPADSEASCRVLLIHSPWLFVEAPKQRPRLESSLNILVAHHTPTDARGRLNYDAVLVEHNASKAFGGPVVWAPISPVCRESFIDAGLTQTCLRHDWTNVVFVDDWGRARTRFTSEIPVVGRHSRPQLEKWPAKRADLLAMYPVDSNFVVKLLGVGEKVRALMEPFPDHWMTWEFDQIPVRDFLAEIDFFVYFHHPDWIETFGLTIAEAAAAGCVVITHPYLEKTFGKAALYCSPEGAPALVETISQEPHYFAELSAQGRATVDDKFGPEAYLRRFQRLHAASQDQALLADLVFQPERSARLWLRRGAKRSAYWARSGLLPGWQRLTRSKAVRRRTRKLRKALRFG